MSLFNLYLYTKSHLQERPVQASGSDETGKKGKFNDGFIK